MSNELDKRQEAAVRKRPAKEDERQMDELGMDGLWMVATRFAQSDIIPREMQGKPANCFMVCVWAQENDVPIVQAFQNTMVVNGRLSVWGDLLLAMVQRSPDYIKHEEGYEGKPGTDEYTAVTRIWRKGAEIPYEGKFSIGQAKKAKLWGKNVWASYPDRMLKMRARTFAARDGFADALKGLTSAEEAQDIQIKPANVEVVDPKKPPPIENMFGSLTQAEQLPEPEQSEGANPPASERPQEGGEEVQESLSQPVEEVRSQASTQQSEESDAEQQEEVPQDDPAPQNSESEKPTRQSMMAEIKAIVTAKHLSPNAVKEYINATWDKANSSKLTTTEVSSLLDMINDQPELFLEVDL